MPTESVDTKSPLKSKTMWTNLLLGLALLINQSIQGVDITPGETGAFVVIVNMLLRLVTKGRIALS